jgi:hypothetical protein
VPDYALRNDIVSELPERIGGVRSLVADARGTLDDVTRRYPELRAELDSYLLVCDTYHGENAAAVPAGSGTATHAFVSAVSHLARAAVNLCEACSDILVESESILP